MPDPEISNQDKPCPQLYTLGLQVVVEAANGSSENENIYYHSDNAQPVQPKYSDGGEFKRKIESVLEEQEPISQSECTPQADRPMMF